MYDPINRYENLFPMRQKQADELCLIIDGDSSSGLCVCVAGPWGSGEASLVLGALEKHRNDLPANGYVLIFLLAMELDNLSSLFSYLFSRWDDLDFAPGNCVSTSRSIRWAANRTIILPSAMVELLAEYKKVPSLN